MLRAPFIVVADRGVVKAYELRQTAKHGTAARLVMETKLEEAHERYRDKVTDQAGAFPPTGNGGHGNAIAAPAEINSAILQYIPADVQKILEQNLKHDLAKIPAASLGEHFAHRVLRLATCRHVKYHAEAKQRGRNRQRRDTVDDKKVIETINELAREEHELFAKESHGTASDADRERLLRLQIMLDQCWDLLRQREARRAAGLDPDAAQVRDEKTVEGYT